MKLCLTCNFQTVQAGETLCPRDGSTLVLIGDDPLLGVIIEGRYRIQSVLGQGSSGTVYKATQELIGREVAVKVLHEHLVLDDEFIKRFKQEAKASSRLTHPNIITIYDFGVIPLGNRPYIAMDLLKGTPLSDLIAEKNHLLPEEALPIFEQVASALGEAHKHGIIHRDIKPENIVLVDRSGQKLFPVVVDFGIARCVQADPEYAHLTRTGTVCGSPTYMSPEQCVSSKVDHLSDQYSLAVVLFEALTGQVPFPSDEVVQVMMMHISTPAPTLSSVRPDLKFRPELEQIFAQALSKKPEERYANMEEFAQALTQAAKQPEKPAVLLSATPVFTAPKDPGPLALSHEQAGINKEYLGNTPNPLPSQRVLANRLLEELAQHTAVASSPRPNNSILTEELDPNKTAALPTLPPASPIPPLSPSSSEKPTRRKVSTALRLSSMGQNNFSLIFVTIGLLLIIIVAARGPLAAKFSSVKVPDSVEVLLKQGKLENALTILTERQQTGTLNKIDEDNLNKVYLSLAKQYAAHRRFAKAVTLLKQIPEESKQAAYAQILLKRYRQVQPALR